MPDRTTPKKLAGDAIDQLTVASDPVTAAGARNYFKAYDEIEFFGVKTPGVRRIERALFDRIRNEWGIDEAVEFCDLMIRRRELEAKTTGIMLLGRLKKSFDRKLLKNTESWLGEYHCADWASTDALSNIVIAEILRNQPDLITRIKPWTKKRNLWLRRAAAVSVIKFARRGQHLDEIYEIVEALIEYPEDLIHKASGWLLREAGKTDAGRLEAFLLEFGSKIPRTTVRYAIERFPEKKRQRLLEKTRPIIDN